TSPPVVNIPPIDDTSSFGKINKICTSVFYRDVKFFLEIPLEKKISVPKTETGLLRTFGGMYLYVNIYDELVCEVVWKVEDGRVPKSMEVDMVEESNHTTVDKMDVDTRMELEEGLPGKKPKRTLRQLRETSCFGRVVNRLEDSVTNSVQDQEEKERVLTWFELCLPHIHAEVERARRQYLKDVKNVIVKQPFDLHTLKATLPDTPMARSMAAEFEKGKCCFGRDVKVLPAGRGRGNVDGGILVYDPGVVHPVTAANEKGDLFFFGDSFSRFQRDARGKISKYQSEIDKRLDEAPEIIALQAKIAQVDEDRKNHQGPYDSNKFKEDEGKKAKLLSEIGHLKVVLQGKFPETRELHQHILRLRAEVKARSTRFMDEFSNFCCAFGTIVAPAFDTKSVSSKRRKTQLDKESKDLLKSINHEGLLKRIKQKVEASGGVVIVTSEAFTTKTCSRCGHHRTVGRARIYSCTKCKAVMDRDGNAAMNILRDTLLRVLEHHSQHKSTAQTSQVVQTVKTPQIDRFLSSLNQKVSPTAARPRVINPGQ
ncbi:hypothetical protein HDU96_006259, partial [Phlyctochytrium bullatum]